MLSGLHPATGQPLEPNGAVPDRIEVDLPVMGRRGMWATHSIDLWDPQGRPLWLEHPQHGRTVDLAAIRFVCPEGYTHYPLNTVKFDEIPVEVAQDVFILGFPLAIAGGGRFPIWKRGSIASEPDLDLDGLPKVLIDTATREGMSGAPVIVQFIGYYAENPDAPSLNDWFGMGRCLLGVYSGRLPGKSESEAQLGIVWKARALLEIIDAGVRPC